VLRTAQATARGVGGSRLAAQGGAALPGRAAAERSTAWRATGRGALAARTLGYTRLLLFLVSALANTPARARAGLAGVRGEPPLGDTDRPTAGIAAAYRAR
jgi:hypothetical protein